MRQAERERRPGRAPTFDGEKPALSLNGKVIKNGA
jgi:hypothetical protein